MYSLGEDQPREGELRALFLGPFALGDGLNASAFRLRVQSCPDCRRFHVRRYRPGWAGLWVPPCGQEEGRPGQEDEDAGSSGRCAPFRPGE